jgi:hypothetical protein
MMTEVAHMGQEKNGQEPSSSRLHRFVTIVSFPCGIPVKWATNPAMWVHPEWWPED